MEENNKHIFIFTLKTLFILLFIITGCTNTSIPEVFVQPDDFPETIKLTTSKKNDFHQLIPSSLTIIDSMIVVSDYRESPRLHIYNKNSDEYLHGFGVIGRGPNEYSAPEWNGQFFLKNDNLDKFIYISEFGYGLIHELNFSKILRNDKNFKIKKYYLPPEVMNADNLVFKNDTLYGEATSNLNVKYFKHKLGSKSFKAIGQFNPHKIVKNSKSVDEKVNLDRSFLCYSPEKSKFISAYLRFNKVIIMDDNMDEELLIYFGNKKKYPGTKDLMSKKNEYYFRKPFAGKKYIYVPYVGQKVSEGMYPKELHVYDYKGKPIKRYLLNETFTSFTIDEENKKLYLITNLEEKQFLTYDL
jgi:hypothetical protein